MKTLWSRGKSKGWPFLELDKQKMAMRHHYPDQRKFNPEIEYVRKEGALYFVSVSFQKRQHEPKAPRTTRVDVYDERGFLMLFEGRSLKAAKEWTITKGK